MLPRRVIVAARPAGRFVFYAETGKSRARRAARAEDYAFVPRINYGNVIKSQSFEIEPSR